MVLPLLPQDSICKEKRDWVRKRKDKSTSLICILNLNLSFAVVPNFQAYFGRIEISPTCPIRCTTCSLPFGTDLLGEKGNYENKGGLELELECCKYKNEIKRCRQICAMPIITNSQVLPKAKLCRIYGAGTKKNGKETCEFKLWVDIN